MQVAIIGAGNVGRALGGSSVRAGHRVTLSATSPENARLVAKETDAQAADTNREAVESAEVVVLAVPYTAVEGILDELGAAFDGKILLDVTNPLNADAPALAIEGTSEAELIQARVPTAHVVKAPNTTFAPRNADPVVDGVAIDGLVAGDDEGAKQAVLDLVGSIGFRPIDAGPLGMARVLEAMGLLNISLQIRNGWPWQTGWRLVGPTS